MEGFPLIWLYTVDNFSSLPIETKLIMTRKLVRSMENSLHLVYHLGPRADESHVQFLACIEHVKSCLAQHRAACDLVQNGIYDSPGILNGHSVDGGGEG